MRARILYTTLKIKLINIDRDKKIRWKDIYRKPLDFWWIFNNDRGGGDTHVFIRQKAWPSRINVTPENPDEFVAECNKLRKKFF